MAQRMFTFIVLTCCTISIRSSASYNQDEQPYFPLSEQHLQEILDKNHWRQPPPPPPVNVTAELARLNSSYIWQKNWPLSNPKLGVVSAVAFDNSHNVVVFHRSDRVWNSQTFNSENVYQVTRSPIPVSTIIAYNRNTGMVAYQLGRSMFFMPHGITVDVENNFWITDVALHQVMKLKINGSDLSKELVLGEAFVPGNSLHRFCKPTSVAVLPDGDFFVADGYCNSRIIKYSKLGERLMSWGRNVFQGHAHDIAPENYFAIPHALTLALDLGLLCVADREDGRVQCFHIKNGTFHSQYHSPVIGDRLFSVAYAPLGDAGRLYVVNGPRLNNEQSYWEVLGFVIDMKTKKIVSKFGPANGPFHNPHDIIVSPDGTEIYVAELDPYVAYKFLNTDIKVYNESVNSKPTSTLLDVALNPITSSSNHITGTPKARYENSFTTSMLIGTLCVSAVVAAAAGIVFLIRRRKRGCCPFGTRNRRHAWDFPTVKSDSFKLGSILDRKRGFEKLNQDASDEEPTATTNMLT